MVAIGPKDDVERIVLSAIKARTRTKRQQPASMNVVGYIVTAALVGAVFSLLLVAMMDWRARQNVEQMLMFHEAVSAAK